MMRVTNSMIVKRTKSNINTNRSRVDYTNNQMSIQKKIVKPSDNPIIAIRSLRLRSTLSTINQYYENNIPDAEAWMECTQTAIVNMKDLISDAYHQAVYGTNDVLEPEDRQAILKELQSLQQQIYSEGNADYDRRTIFTGYKTNQSVTFMNSAEAKDAHYYDIVQKLTYKDIEKKNYYVGKFEDTSKTTLTTTSPDAFKEVQVNRLRLAYDKITEDKNTLSISYTENNLTTTITMSAGGTTWSTQGCTFAVGTDGATPPNLAIVVTPPEGYFAVPSTLSTSGTLVDGTKYSTELYKKSDYDYDATTGLITKKSNVKDPEPKKEVFVHYDATSTPLQLLPDIGGQKLTIGGEFLTYRVSNTSDLEDRRYSIKDSEIVFDYENGELLFKDELANIFDRLQASFSFVYDKDGFEEGELHPEYFFDCKREMQDRKEDITYTNFDENGNWITQAINYNIASGQQMQINTEAREIFDTNIRRDITEMIDVVNMAIAAHETVDEIEAKIKSGEYEGVELDQLNKWLDAAKTQRDYADQNLHDTYSAYITKFQGYLDDIDLGLTDLGGRQARVELTKTRMNVQQSTFKELKSINEDMDLSDLVINYTAATVAYQAALQAAAKIGKMTLLDFI